MKNKETKKGHTCAKGIFSPFSLKKEINIPDRLHDWSESFDYLMLFNLTYNEYLFLFC